MPAAAGAASFTLRSMVWTIESGPQQGLEVQVEDEPVRIGSAGDNSLVLTDATVSRHHAEVQAVPGGFLLRDLSSTNGTFIEGHRVNEVLLAPVGRIRFGQMTVAYRPEHLPILVKPGPEQSFGGLYGQSKAMLQLFGILRRISASDVTVILSGETGTGKEVAARSIHAASRRSNGPFSVLDGSVVDRDLISSELFGHEVGAFTGAVKARQGAIEQAQEGTLFIDEVGELPLEIQAKLLRALEQREIRRLGGTTAVKVDCRVIAATHRDLASMVKNQTFRQDLYFRLAQVTVRLPPLRERREDIPGLVDRFLEAACRGAPGKTFTNAALDLLNSAHLEGNVRELRNIVERACALSTGPKIEPEELGLSTGNPPVDEGRDAPPAFPSSWTALELAERTAILDVLEGNGYHQGKAAEALGISRPTLREKIRKYGIPFRETKWGKR